MRRYELMLVIRPDVAGRPSQALLDRTTRQIVAGGGQIVKVGPWGRRRLAYPIDRYREGSYHIILFEAPAEAIAELEREPAHHRGGPPPPRDPRRAPAQGRAPRRRRTTLRRPAVLASDEERGAGRRAHRRVRERGGSGRHRLSRPRADRRTPMSLNKVMIIGNLGRDPEMRYTPERPGGHPVHGRREPQLQGPGRRVAGGDRVVPGRCLGASSPSGPPSTFARARKVYVEGRLQTRAVGRPAGPEALHDGAVANQRDARSTAGPRGRRRCGAVPADSARPAATISPPALRGRRPGRRPSDIDDLPF